VSPQGPDSRADELREQYRVKLAWVGVVWTAVLFVSIGALALMAEPLAHQIAGKHTSFTLSASVSLNLILGVTAALVGGAAYQQWRNATRNRTRSGELQQRVKDLQAKLAQSGPEGGKTAGEPSE